MRILMLDENLCGRTLLRVAVHEATHSACPDLGEAAVLRIEENVMEVLEALSPDLFDEIGEENANEKSSSGSVQRLSFLSRLRRLFEDG